MARERKAAPGIGHNGSMPPADTLEKYMGRVRQLYADLEDERTKYQNIAKEIRADIGDLIAEAEGAGIPSRAFMAVIKYDRLRDKLDQVRGDLKPSEAETFDQIRLALGGLADTPLGRAALARAERTGV
jgi:hypothetical protein